MKKIPFSKRTFNELNKKLVEDKKKPIRYKKYLDAKIKNLIEKYIGGVEKWNHSEIAFFLESQGIL